MSHMANNIDGLWGNPNVAGLWGLRQPVSKWPP